MTDQDLSSFPTALAYSPLPDPFVRLSTRALTLNKPKPKPRITAIVSTLTLLSKFRPAPRVSDVYRFKSQRKYGPTPIKRGFMRVIGDPNCDQPRLG